MTACDLELEILPPYIGSAVSPTVDITETTDDITVTITDFRGEHAYTVDKTDQAIADAEQAASNANTAAANATSTANAAAQYARDTADQAAADAQATADEAAGRADTAAGGANQAAQAATAAAGTANTSAQNADTKAALADSKAALAQSAATTANTAAQAAEAAKTAANTAAGQATTAAGNANTAAQSATTAATNADAKAQLADTAAANADTATQAANTATTNATNAAQAANNAADVAIEAADDMPKLIATVDSVQTVSDAWPTTLHGATLYGKSVQDGTPTPSAPVAVQTVGGNLLDGVKYAGLIINTNGTIGRNATTNVYSAKVEKNATYTVSGVNIDRMAIASSPTKEITAGMGGTGIIAYRSPYTGSSYTFNSGDAEYVAFYLSSNGTETELMLEQGTTANPYTPYGCIGLKIGETVTPIDLQGHTLAGLPDETRDELDIDAAGVKAIGKRVGEFTLDGSEAWNKTSATAIDDFYFNAGATAKYGSIVGTRYNYNILCNRFTGGAANAANHISTDNKYIHITFAAGTFANVSELKTWLAQNETTFMCELATPATIVLGTIDLPELTNPCELAIYASLDPDWQIEYTQDPSIVVNTLQSSIAPVEGATASTNYSVGAYLMHGNQLYRVTSAIATGEAITPGSNCVSCTVMGEVIRLTA